VRAAHELKVLDVVRSTSAEGKLVVNGQVLADLAACDATPVLMASIEESQSQMRPSRTELSAPLANKGPLGLHCRQALRLSLMIRCNDVAEHFKANRSQVGKRPASAATRFVEQRVVTQLVGCPKVSYGVSCVSAAIFRQDSRDLAPTRRQSHHICEIDA
jgi:hypothetical protein